MIETIYQAPMIFKQWKPINELEWSMSVDEILSVLPDVVDDLEYKAYVAPANEALINQANDWLKQAKYAQPTPTGPITKKQHLLNYQKEYYMKNQDKRKKEMAYNYNTMRIKVLEDKIKSIEEDDTLTTRIKNNRVNKVQAKIDEHKRRRDD